MIGSFLIFQAAKYLRVSALSSFDVFHDTQNLLVEIACLTCVLAFSGMVLRFWAAGDEKRRVRELPMGVQVQMN